MSMTTHSLFLPLLAPTSGQWPSTLRKGRIMPNTLRVPATHVMAWLNILTVLLRCCATVVDVSSHLVSIPMAEVLFLGMLGAKWHCGFTSIKLVRVRDDG
jgi:hypothetical protein